MLPHIHYLSFIKKNQKSNIGWPQQPLTEKMLPHWAQKPNFLKKLPDIDDLIIPGTKMTNTGPFLWNGS